jgi:protein phosphatase
MSDDERVVIGENSGMYGASKVGLREKDEDFVCGFSMKTTHGWTLRAAVLCDGMGGGERGEDASKLAAKTFLDGIRDALGPKPKGGLLARAARLGKRAGSSSTDSKPNISTFSNALSREQLWRSLIGTCHQKVRALSEGRKVGTTLTALIFSQRRTGVNWCDLIHIGDSRCYRLAKTAAECELMSEDDSLTGEMHRGGYIELHEIPKTHGHNVLTKSIGMDELPDATITAHELSSGDRFLLCCDGIWGSLHDESGLWLPDSASTLQSQVDTWVDEALAKGSTDNCSGLLLVV